MKGYIIQKSHTHTYLAGTWRPETEWCFVKNGTHLNGCRSDATSDRPAPTQVRSSRCCRRRHGPADQNRAAAAIRPFYHHRQDRHRMRTWPMHQIETSETSARRSAQPKIYGRRALLRRDDGAAGVAQFAQVSTACGGGPLWRQSK